MADMRQTFVFDFALRRTLRRFAALSGFAVCLCAFALLGSGCGAGGSGGSGQRASDWVGLTGPVIEGAAPTLTIMPATQTLTTGRQMQVLVIGRNEYGRPLADGVKLQLSSQLGTTAESAEISTTGGMALFLITGGPSAGLETLTVSGAGVFTTATLQLVAEAIEIPQISISPASDTVKPSGVLPIVVFVRNATGAPLATDVTLLSDLGGTFDKNTGTSAGGYFVSYYTAPVDPGQDVITV
ncbi:MAG TPA: hypothetical protein PKO06_22895, partial [Candidatus Ozemobacteraceae bacterium]|nr:hypothetical protein [Candidatus Ozemobacteraceae bacterium]